MHHAFLDEYAHIKSPLQKIPSQFKIAGLVLFIFLVVLTPIQIWWAYIIYVGMLFVLVLISRLPLTFIVKRLLVIMPFLLILLVSVPFLHKADRWMIFTRCLMRSMLCCLGIIIVFASTKFTHVLEGFKKLHVPQIIIMIISFMYRYIFVIEDEFLRMQRAFQSRNVRNKKGWFFTRSFANMVGVLFIRAYERAERIYLAMCARGFSERKGN